MKRTEDEIHIRVECSKQATWARRGRGRGLDGRSNAGGLLEGTSQPLKYLEIKEKVIRKGSRYATAHTNLDKGRVIDFVEERPQ